VVRDLLLGRDDLGPELRQIAMRAVAEALSGFVAQCGWLGPDRARRAAAEACDRGALALAGQTSDPRAFVLHLAGRGEFTPSLALRAVLCGELRFFEAALSALSGRAPARVTGFVREFDGRGFEAVYLEAGFPRSALPIFRAALAAARDAGPASRAVSGAGLSRRTVERALAACEGHEPEVEALRALLRRFAAEAARAQARRNHPATPTPTRVARAA
jgi:uncharacterized protein (DUF2336 family)